MPEKLYILHFSDVEEAIEFANECKFSDRSDDLRKESEGDEAWICVLGLCDICSETLIFFAPAVIYDEDITGVECSNCHNQSVYPKEGSFDDE